MPLFPSPLDLTTLAGKQAQTVKLIDARIQQAAASLKAAYDELRKQVYINPLKLTPTEVHSAFQQLTVTGLNATQLSELARVVKAVANRYQENVISDDVPPATITV